MKPTQKRPEGNSATPETLAADTPAGSASSLATGRGALRRAFVVEVADDCDAAGGQLSGRVQHLATSDGGNFASIEALLAIVHRILAEDGAGSDRQD
ncbi:MAG TPA: hypothetical protein VEC57_08030 [Candidatus Limnocylindrales bacterium]|nr:hypothetical protein [Candidatus Limnocylindrales bacterium]